MEKAPQIVDLRGFPFAGWSLLLEIAVCVAAPGQRADGVSVCTAATKVGGASS
jgi:hypothetical protein